MNKVTCYFDGSCEPTNPGGAMGSGSLIKVDGVIVYSESKFYAAHPKNTNNVAEYIGLGLILKYILDNGLDEKDVTIMGDSQLVIRQMTGEYSIKSGAYVKYALRCKELLAKFRSKPVLFWIKREQNSEADQLSKGNLHSNGIEIKTHSENKSEIYFGKYKGKLVDDVDDIDYLKWLLKSVRMKGQLRALIQSRINQLEFLGR